jgi:DNA invertase Pin-like site-specific DNA recombinase
MIRYVTYRRVSTKEQGKSGLGLDAQTRDITAYLELYSHQPYEVIGDFTDIISGGEDVRPELDKALVLAKKSKAVLLVAKLDRLSRKVSFIATLMEDKTIQFKVANLPQADKMQLHLYAMLAEQERDFISQRTKSALREAKARGVILGGLRDSTLKRNQARQAYAMSQAKSLESIVKPLKAQGMRVAHISEALNKANIKAPKGGKWSSIQVSRVLKRLGI